MAAVLPHGTSAAGDEFVNFTGTKRKIAKGDAPRVADFKEIPIIDFEGEKAAVVQAIKDACTNTGFFYLKNHGIPQSIIDDAFQNAEQFFSLPDDTKAQIAATEANGHRGFEGISKAQFDNQKTNLHEDFLFFYDPALDPTPPTDTAPEASKGENQWPTTPSSFQPALSAYYGEILLLSRRLIRYFALALDLPETYFDSVMTRPWSTAKLLHYPPQAAQTVDSAIGIGAHTDFECFTLLAQGAAAVPSLQVLSAAGEWISAPPVEGTFVVNIGDMLSMWTNDLFKSTIHRVINMTGKERYSMAVFVAPNHETLIKPLENFKGEGGQQQEFEPVTSGEYVWKRILATRQGY